VGGQIGQWGKRFSENKTNQITKVNFPEGANEISGGGPAGMKEDFKLAQDEKGDDT